MKASRAEALASLYQAAGEMLGAERRLRTRDRLSVDGVTLPQVVTLITLTAGDATVGALARVADVTPATMTVLLDELESEGIIVRGRSADDRRVVVVSLTERGLEHANRRRRDWEARWGSEFADLSDEEILTTAGGVRRIVSIFDAIGNDDPPPVQDEDLELTRRTRSR